MKNNYFEIGNKKYTTKYISCININNIENYLKRLELNKTVVSCIILPQNKHATEKIDWAVFQAMNKFNDKINIAKDLETEMLLILNNTNQIHQIIRENQEKNQILIINKL
ncbi:MAG: hypothetical protein WCX82_04725 [archaeon]|jgi:tRNA threonylcarbamoyladenosine modification (KEOPS) complex Cgi121 subunit